MRTYVTGGLVVSCVDEGPSWGWTEPLRPISTLIRTLIWSKIIRKQNAKPDSEIIIDKNEEEEGKEEEREEEVEGGEDDTTSFV